MIVRREWNRTPWKGIFNHEGGHTACIFTIQILCWRNLCSNYLLVMSIMTYDVQWPWTPIDFRLFDVFVSGFNFLPYHKNCIQSHLNFTWPMKNPQVLSRWWFSLVRVNKCVNRNKRCCGVKELSTAVRSKSQISLQMLALIVLSSSFS